MKQTLKDMVGVRKRSAREKLFSLRSYDLNPRRTRAADSTELAEKPSNQSDESRRTSRVIARKVYCVL